MKFTRREGEKRDDDQARPLKVVLRRKDDRDLILANVYKLSKCEQEEWRKVTVGSDLTKMQRNDEVELRKLAASKNLVLTKEDIDKGEAWKVVGKRGNKRIQLIRLYRDEMVTETGEVRFRETLAMRGKRGRSPGSSPSLPRSRQRIEPGEFGDREEGADQRE